MRASPDYAVFDDHNVWRAAARHTHEFAFSFPGYAPSVSDRRFDRRSDDRPHVEVRRSPVIHRIREQLAPARRHPTAGRLRGGHADRAAPHCRVLASTSPHSQPPPASTSPSARRRFNSRPLGCKARGPRIPPSLPAPTATRPGPTTPPDPPINTVSRHETCHGRVQTPAVAADRVDGF